MSCVETDTRIVDKFSGISDNPREMEELYPQRALILKKEVFQADDERDAKFR